MELAGTIVLPAAISFTLYLIIVAIIPGTVKPVLPLILLAIILGLPAFLIVMTTRKVAYLGWMFIYLLSLPIWSGVLPLYAFMHMVSPSSPSASRARVLTSLLSPGRLQLVRFDLSRSLLDTY